MEIMFETFNVPAFYLNKQEVFTLYSDENTNGIVLNVGQQVTTVVPIFGKPEFKKDIMCTNIGGLDVTKCFQDSLIKKGHDFASTSSIFSIDQIKESVGYVALDYNEELKKSNDIEYLLPDFSVINISDERFRCTEGLFDPILFNKECRGVDKVLYDSIIASNYNKNVHCSNIILSGCTTLFDGFPERLAKELEKTKLNFKLINYSNKGESVWFGETIVASSPSFPEMAITLNEYKENGKSFVNVKC